MPTVRALGLALVVVLSPFLALAQSNPTYVQFRPSAVKGVLYRPDSGPAPRVAVLLMHRTSNFLSHIACTELAKRGFLVLGMNPRSDNNEASVMWDENALDVKSGVEFLRKQPGIAKIVLLGHSGGGPTMSFYQAVAEKGVSYCQGPAKLVECGNELAGLPRADGLILVDAHPGYSVNGLRGLNPALVTEGQPAPLDPALDPFSPANGYNPKGPSSYSDEFKRRYFKAQADRMNRLIGLALDRLRRLKTGDPYPDDDVFMVVRGQGARLMEVDLSIHARTIAPQKLLRNDGTVVEQIAQSVRPPNLSMADQNASFSGGTRLLTVKSFLSANAIRAKDSLEEIDWCSSNSATPCALKQISVPLLVTAMGAHYFIRDNEIHYEVAASADKDFVIVEGATHGIVPCTACERTPGQYANTVRNYFDYVARWISERF